MDGGAIQSPQIAVELRDDSGARAKGGPLPDPFEAARNAGIRLKAEREVRWCFRIAQRARD